MGLKNDDKCLAKVKDDEPIFVLRAQDRLAPAMVRLWADMAAMHGLSKEKYDEAIEIAEEMEGWDIEEQQAARPGAKFPD